MTSSTTHTAAVSPITGLADEVMEVGLAVPHVLVLECGYDMTDYLAAAPAALERLRMLVRRHPLASSSVHLGVVTFDNAAHLRLPLAQIADPAVVLPALERGAFGTDLGSACSGAGDLLRAGLRSLGLLPDGARRRVFRPNVHIITSGDHNAGDDWRPRLDELLSGPAIPRMSCFGTADADQDVIASIADEGRGFVLAPGSEADTFFDFVLAVVARWLLAPFDSLAQSGPPPYGLVPVSRNVPTDV